MRTTIYARIMRSKRTATRPQLASLIVLSVILLAAAAVLSSQTTAATNEGAPTTTTHERQRVRVLLVRNSDKQHAIEEASSLSLDLPATSSSAGLNSQQQQRQQQQQFQQQQQLHEQRANGSQVSSNGSSAGYQQHSLAALTLNQRTIRAPPPQQANDATATTSYENAALANKDNATAAAAAAAARGREQKLGEIELPRSKPSWLNVSSRYKITGSSIEEIQYMMPPEYYLRQAFDAPVLLKTKLGILEGVRSIKFNKHLYTFLSVPYAKPPVDELRFKSPQPIEKWEGIMQATKWPPFCVQPSMTLASKSSPVHPLSQMMSEDCLYMNIWTPSLKFNRHRKRPVMVWIHGGAFQYGGISVDENDGSALALAGDVVVVAMNYRVSAFGFLNANNREHGPNNVGLLDQRLAMQWVQENIKQFGGDPQQVTLFGESAGGHSVGLHLISPGSQPFFKRAILQSGVPISFLRSYDVNSDNKGSVLGESVSSIMMAKRLKCYNSTSELLFVNETLTTTQTTPASEEASENESTATDSNLTSSSAAAGATSADQSDVELDDQPILSDETLACMRQRSSLEILKAMGVPGNAGFFPTGSDARGFFPNGPIMDSFDGENLKVGAQKDYLIGTNTDEGTFMLHYGMPSLFPSRAPPRVSSIEQLKASLQSEIQRMSAEAAEVERQDRVANSSQADIRAASGAQNGGAQAHLYRPLLKTSTSVLEGFMPKSQVRVLDNGTVVGNTTFWSKETEFGKGVGSLITDIIFLCPARALARTLAENGRNVYFYLYSHRSSMTPYHDWIGVTHHDEVEFVFGRPLRLADVYSGKDIEMSQRLIKIWSHFAYTGQALAQFNVEWPKYGIEDNNYMNLEPGQASVGQRYHDRVCNIYETVISVHLRDT